MLLTSKKSFLNLEPWEMARKGNKMIKETNVLSAGSKIF